MKTIRRNTFGLLVASFASLPAFVVMSMTRVQAAPTQIALVLQLEGDFGGDDAREQLRAAIANELGIDVAIKSAAGPAPATLSIKFVAPSDAVIVFTAHASSVSRTVHLPDKPAARIEVFTLIAGNLARDEAGDWLAQWQAKMAVSVGSASVSSPPSVAANDRWFSPSPPAVVATAPSSPVASASAVPGPSIYSSPQIQEGEGDFAPIAPHKASPNIEVGLRVGYGVAGGLITNNSTFLGAVNGRIPIELDMGYRFSPQFTLGILVGYSVILAGDSFTAAFGYGNGTFGNQTYSSPGTAEAISSNVDRVDLVESAVNARWHFNPTGSVDPWIGAMFGWNVLDYKFSSNATPRVTSNGTSDAVVANQSSNLNGPFGGLEAGLTIRLSNDFGIGPFVSALYSSYSNTVDGGPNNNTGNNVVSGQAHYWLMGGIRGSFGYDL